MAQSPHDSLNSGWHNTSFRGFAGSLPIRLLSMNFDLSLVKHVKNVPMSGVGMNLASACTSAGKVVLSYVTKYVAAKEAGVFGAGFRTSVEPSNILIPCTIH